MREGTSIRLARVLFIVVLMSLGVALAEDPADEAKVNNGTKDLVTTTQGSVYESDQSVTGTGLANIYNNLAVVNPKDNSQVLNLKILTSGTGDYSHDSYVYVQNNSMTGNHGDFVSFDHKITAKDDSSAVYTPVSFQFPGSFKVKTIKSLWKDQTCAKNYAGMISIDSLFDYAKALRKKSTITMYSVDHTYQAYLASENSTTKSSMDITSDFDGSAHLGVTLADVRGGISGITKAKADGTVLMDEDYRGSFNLTKKMAVNIKKTTAYGYYEKNYEGLFDKKKLDDYPWLPCACNAGWDDMTIHDQRYHSAKEFFDCTTCWPPGPCMN
jgi:hypothetical protein